MKRRVIRIVFLFSLIVCLAMPIMSFAAGSVPQAVLDASESVVRITCEDAEWFYTGSGFVISCGKGGTFIATNRHVIDGNIFNLEVWTDEYDDVAATVFYEDESRDLAILKLNKNLDLPVIDISSKGVDRGDVVYAIGFPAAADGLSDTMAYGSEAATITSGNISAIRDLTLTAYGSRSVELLQTDASINSGDSGGPLVDGNGHVVGINTYGMDESQGINGAVSVTELKAVAKKADVELSYASGSFALGTWAMIAGGVLLVAVLVLVLVRFIKSRTKKKSAPTVSLADYICRNGVLSPESAVHLLMPALRQLRQMHEDGQLSMNISPDTVFVSDEGSQISGGATTQYASGFTPPEVYRGRNAGAASDIYSMCAVLLYACTGAAPMNSLNRMDTEEEDTSFVSLRELRPEISDIIERGMDLTPDNRYQMVSALIRELLPYNIRTAEGKTVSSTGVKPVEKKHVPRPRKKLLLPMPVKIVILAVLIITLYFGYGLFMWNHAVHASFNNSFIEAKRYLNLCGPFATLNMKLNDMEQFPQYIEAGVSFERGDYAIAAERYQALGSLWDSEKKGKVSVINHIEQLIDDSHYQDANKYLKNSQWNMIVFLLGAWKNNELSYHFTFYHKGDEYIIKSNYIKGFSESHLYINKSTLLIGEDEKTATERFEIHVINENTIRIYDTQSRDGFVVERQN